VGVGNKEGEAVGADDGLGVGLPSTYVGSKVGTLVGGTDGKIVGLIVGLPTE